MTDFNNLSEYEDPELYDLENDDFEPDGPFFLELAQSLGGNVLELGCGTGRLTIPLAQASIPITGLDIVPQMLLHAKNKTAALPIDWIAADARDFALEQRFNLIFESGATFQHMLTLAEQERMLTSVRRHLKADGRFVLSFIFPHSEMLQNEEETNWFEYEHSAGYTVYVSGSQHYDPLSQIKTETAIRSWTNAEGQEIRRIAPLSLRYSFPKEIEALLHYNGFSILEAYGDWDKSALTDASPHLIYVCQIRQK